MANIYLGGTDLSSATLKMGSTDVSAAYLGSTEVWSSAVDPITTNLIAWYDAANASSYPGTGTTVTNISPNSPNVDLTLQGTYTYNSSGVKSFSWGGSSGTHGAAASVPSEIYYLPNYAIGNDFTFECGAYFDGLGNTSFFNTRDTTTYNGINRNGYFFSFNTFVFQGIAAYAYTSATTSLYSTGNWYQILVAGSGTQLKVYVNGAFTETLTISSTRPSMGRTIDLIGAMGAFASGAFVTGGTNFKQQYLRIYNDIQLSDAQVLQNYNSKKSDLGL